MVPIIVVVPEHTVEALSEWAEMDEAREALTPLREQMARNGWTNEAVIGGAALRAAVDAQMGCAP